MRSPSAAVCPLPEGDMSSRERAAPNYIPVDIVVEAHGGYAITGQIWSASERFLRVLLRVPLDAGDLIEMSLHGCRFAAEVAFCQPSPEGYNVGVQLLDRDSVRREPRFPLDLPAVLTVVGSAGPKEAPVRLTDVSASGVGLFSSAALQIGGCVEIDLDLGLLFGEVRHCQVRSDGRYHIGVAIYHMLARERSGKPAGPSAPRFSWLKRGAPER